MIGRTRGVCYVPRSSHLRRWMTGAPEPEGAGWLALDEIVDPQNLGSLCRTARFLGASVLVSAKKLGALECGGVQGVGRCFRRGAGLRRAEFASRRSEDAKAQGWRVLGAGVGDNSVPVSGLDPTQPSVLVVGSEGEGLRTTVRRACDALVQVGSAPDNRAWTRSASASPGRSCCTTCSVGRLSSVVPVLSASAAAASTGLHGAPVTYGPVFY